MMTQRGARWLLVTVALSLAALALLLQRPAPVISSQRPAGQDSARAEQFLAGVRGAGPLVCEMAARSLGMGWSWRGLNQHPDASRESQEAIRWATGRLESADIVPPLVARLEDSDPCVRRLAARLLGRTRHTRAVEALVGALRSANPRTRQLAAVGLGYAEDRTSVDPLLRALRDQEASVRAASAWALGEIEDERPVPALAGVLSGDPDAGVRRAAAIALGNILE